MTPHKHQMPDSTKNVVESAFSFNGSGGQASQELPGIISATQDPFKHAYQQACRLQ